MKKTTKSLLIASLILVIAGLVLALVTLLVAAIMKIDVFGVDAVKRVSVSEDHTLTSILKNSPDADYSRALTTVPYTDISVTSYVGKVEIVPTEGETHVALSNATPDNIQVQVIGSTLTVAEQKQVGFMGIFVDEKGISFKGIRQIFGPGNSANAKKVMTIFLNKEDNVQSITVRSTFGDVRIEDIQAQSLSLQATAGKGYVKGVTCDRMDITKTFGKLVLEDNVCISANASVHFGSVNAHLPHSNDQSTVVDLWVGKCSFTTQSSLDRYKLALNATIGSVAKNGKGNGKSLQEFSDTANRISSSVLIGMINVNGDEAKVSIPTDSETGADDSPSNPSAALPEPPAAAEREAVSPPPDDNGEEGTVDEETAGEEIPVD